MEDESLSRGAVGLHLDALATRPGLVYDLRALLARYPGNQTTQIHLATSCGEQRLQLDDALRVDAFNPDLRRELAELLDDEPVWEGEFETPGT